MTDAEKIMQKLGLKFGLDESSGMEAVTLLMKDRERLIAALNPLMKWAIVNHEMPNYSEVISNADEALAQSALTTKEILG